MSAQSRAIRGQVDNSGVPAKHNTAETQNQLPKQRLVPISWIITSGTGTTQNHKPILGHNMDSRYSKQDLHTMHNIIVLTKLPLLVFKYNLLQLDVSESDASCMGFAHQPD